MKPVNRVFARKYIERDLFFFAKLLDEIGNWCVENKSIVHLSLRGQSEKAMADVYREKGSGGSICSWFITETEHSAEK